MSGYFEQKQRDVESISGPKNGFTIPILGRQVLAPWDNKQRIADDYVTKNKLNSLGPDLRKELENSAPNDWDDIVKSYAGRAAAGEQERGRAKKEALSERTREFNDVESYETRKDARNLASQRAIMDKQAEAQRYAADVGLKGMGMQSEAAIKQAQIGSAGALEQARVQGQYGVKSQEVAGRYNVEGQRVAGMYGLEGQKVGARAQVQTAQIGADASRDVANIGGSWQYKNADLVSGRELTNSREQRMSDERKQTQAAFAQRQAQGQDYKRKEASELLQARLQRGDSGRNFLLSAVGKRYF